MCRLADPTQDELVKLTLAAHRRARGVVQKQARPLRFRGAVKNPLTDAPRGLNVRAALEAGLAAAEIKTGPVFRRVIVRRYAALPARSKVKPNSVGWNARWDSTWLPGSERSSQFSLSKSVGRLGCNVLARSCTEW